jgi:hypothetical protein
MASYSDEASHTSVDAQDDRRARWTTALDGWLRSPRSPASVRNRRLREAVKGGSRKRRASSVISVEVARAVEDFIRSGIVNLSARAMEDRFVQR